MVMGYSKTEGTAFHAVAGLATGIVGGPEIGSLVFALSFFIYQLYDSLPRACHDWMHTKWDVLEFGFPAFVGGMCWFL